MIYITAIVTAIALYICVLVIVDFLKKKSRFANFQSEALLLYSTLKNIERTPDQEKTYAILRVIKKEWDVIPRKQDIRPREPDGSDRLVVRDFLVKGMLFAPNYVKKRVDDGVPVNDPIVIEHEPDNVHSKHAVKVIWRGFAIGYAPDSVGADLLPYLEDGRFICGKVLQTTYVGLKSDSYDIPSVRCRIYLLKE